MAGNSTWLVEMGVLSWYRLRYVFSQRTQDAYAMAVRALLSKTSDQPSGGRKIKGKTRTGNYSTVSIANLDGWSPRQVDQCCKCTQYSICLTLGPSILALHQQIYITQVTSTSPTRCGASVPGKSKATVGRWRRHRQQQERGTEVG